MDTQVVELLGRNRLIDELLRAGLEVAIPERDRGIDLIAYADVISRVKTFIARPIQMKAASAKVFSLHTKYAKFPNLIMAYVWDLEDKKNTCVYALTYQEAFAVCNEMGWTKTASWKKGGYSSNRPSKRLKELLKPYKMTPQKWWKKINESK